MAPPLFHFTKEGDKEEEEVSRAGSMAPAEFDRIWFLRMRSLPRLSLLAEEEEDRCCHPHHHHRHVGQSDCDKLLPSLPVHSLPDLSLGLTRSQKAPDSATPSSGAGENSGGAARAVDGGQKPERPDGEADTDAVAEAVGSTTRPPKKSRWRNKAGGLCNIL